VLQSLWVQSRRRRRRRSAKNAVVSGVIWVESRSANPAGDCAPAARCPARPSLARYGETLHSYRPTNCPTCMDLSATMQLWRHGLGWPPVSFASVVRLQGRDVCNHRTDFMPHKVTVNDSCRDDLCNCFVRATIAAIVVATITTMAEARVVAVVTTPARFIHRLDVAV